VQTDRALIRSMCLWSKTQQHAALEGFTASEKQEASSSYMMQCTADSHISCIQRHFHQLSTNLNCCSSILASTWSSQLPISSSAPSGMPQASFTLLLDTILPSCGINNLLGVELTGKIHCSKSQEDMKDPHLIEQGAGVALLDFKRAIYIGLVLLFLHKRPSIIGLDETVKMYHEQCLTTLLAARLVYSTE